MLSLGKISPTTIGEYPAIKAEEMWNIDTKLDDSRPAYGRILSRNLTGRPDCATSNTMSLAEYAVSGAVSEACVVYVQIK